MLQLVAEDLTTDLPMEYDRPQQTKHELGVAVNNVIATDVDQLYLRTS
jgi:hypothetical protein